MRPSDLGFFRYFPISKRDRQWGLYVSTGRGCFESKRSGVLDVVAGTVMLLFPGEWHRYRPAMETGWDEYWVSFGGFWVDGLVREGFFSPE